MSAPERAFIRPCRPCKGPLDYYIWEDGTEYIRADLIPDPAAIVRAALESAAEKTALMPEWLPSSPRLAFQSALDGVDAHIRAIASDPAAVKAIVERANGAGE